MENDTASMTELSPAAQAVSDAIKEEYLLLEPLHPGDAERIAATALRAVGVACVGNPPDFSDPDEVMFSAGWDGCLRYIRSITDELENHD